MADKKVINLDKDDSSTFTFSLVVKADNWNDVITVLKDTLGVTQKLNSSNRDISGLFLVSCSFKAAEITKDFYEKIENSENISIHSDGKSTSLYPKILKEVQVVEERLRWLLLHVSDTIENYLDLVNAKAGVVTKKSLDPITASLTFEKTIDLLGFDQSWSGKLLNADEIAKLAADSKDFAEFQKTLTEKTKPKTIWDSIVELVLDSPKTWQEVQPKLLTIRRIRNKCAHFHTVTDDDLSQVQVLKKNILATLKTTKRATTGKKEYEAFNLEFMKTLSDAVNLRTSTIANLSETVLKANQSLTGLAGGINNLNLPITPSLALSKSLMESVYPITSPFDSLINYNALLRLQQQLGLPDEKKGKDAGEKNE